ncbi:recombinase family protein [Nitratireductor sp. StC3]|uniref:recombinase family protein n=1 Tax=Nitratireductor sp. StC3 TaxID=2126741 RepID=UPI0013047CBF|nr:recombinase family protein [Nitratireductor sp. StC3]
MWFPQLRRNLPGDHATPHGKLTFTLMSAVAEFERDVLIQRTKEGIAAARARGKRIGRPPKLSKRQLSEARRLIDLGASTRAELAEQYGVAEWTLSRAMRREAMRTEV